MAAILLNRYRVLRELADGKFGKTFLAEDTQLPSGKQCVVKQFKPIARNPQIYQIVRERFQREAAILETLGDNNSQIPRLYAYFAEAGEFYLVQEWFQGQTLSDRIQQVGLCSEREVKEILSSILPVLQYIHSQGVIHRDLQPDNIILRSRDSKPVLIDFGMVKEIMGMTVTASGRAKSSLVVGTPGFIPSEQAAGKPLFASDLYALGLTAIYLLTGKMPPEFETHPLTGEILWRPHAFNLSPSFAAFLDKTIHQSARDRYMNAPAMLTALQQLDRHTASATAIPPQPESPPPVAATPTPTVASEPSPPIPAAIPTPASTIDRNKTSNAAVPAGIGSEQFNPSTARNRLVTLAKVGFIALGSLVALAVLLVAISYITKPKANSSSNNFPTKPTKQNSLGTSTAPPTAESQPSAAISQPETTTKNFDEQVKLGQLKTYTYSTNLFSINVPQDWQRRDRSTIGEAIVSWYDPTNRAAIVVDVFSREAFQQTGQITQARLNRFLAKAVQQQYRSNPDFQLASTAAASNGWLQINWSYSANNQQHEKGKMLGYGYVRQDSDKISYIHFIVPAAQYPQLRSQLSKIITSYSINASAPLP
jgi:serine/threonine-protein kinase